MNIQGLYEQDYFLVQVGTISFKLLSKDMLLKSNGNNMTFLIEFDIDDITDTVEFVHQRLLKEIDYNIGMIDEANPEDIADFNMTDKELEDYYQEIKLIGNILR